MSKSTGTAVRIAGGLAARAGAGGSGPALSNFLADLAERIGAHADRYRRSTHAAAESALEAGRLLVEARAECRHGEWLAFLARAGMADRTARNWMRLARSGLDAGNIVAAGGVRAALLTLANPKAIAIVERQADELAAEAKSATVADLPDPAGPSNPPEIEGIETPEPVGTRPVVHGSALAGGESRSMRESVAHSELTGPQAPDSNRGGSAFLETEPGRGMTLYQWRRARGECTVCGAPADGKARCDGCAEALNVRRRARTRFTAELAPRIEAAAKAGRGVRLTAAEVAHLSGRREAGR